MTNVACQTYRRLTKWQTMTRFEYSLTRGRGGRPKGPKGRKRPKGPKGPKGRKRPKGKKKYPLGPFGLF